MAEYIDKHEAYKILKDLASAYIQVAVKEAYETAALRIDQMHPKDVQPVKRGEWEKKSSVGVFRCSLCQHIFMLGADEIDEYHFCPHCGADMRGDENA